MSLSFKKVAVAESAIAAFYAATNGNPDRSGIIVEVGAEFTDIVPFHKQERLRTYETRMAIGGNTITRFLRALLDEKGHKIPFLTYDSGTIETIMDFISNSSKVLGSIKGTADTTTLLNEYI